MANLRNINWCAAGERLLLTVWVGGLWIIGYLVAPSLFALLDDRQLAGQLAGHMFRIIAYIGLVAGTLLLLSTLRNIQHNIAGGKGWRREWRVWALLGMLVLVAIGSFVLQPMMQVLKAQGIAAGTATAAQFGRLHGVSSILYLLTSLLGLALVLLGIRREN